MSIDPGSVASLGTALANPTRVSMCLALLDGRAWTAGELARASGVAKSTTTEHLRALIDAGLLIDERQGRHVYLRLASAEAAHVVETMTSFSGTPAKVASLRTASTRDGLAKARTCYDHLAGALGVAIYDSMVANGALTDTHGVALTSAGHAFVTSLVGPHALSSPTRRPLLRTCLDWTERRHHLAGHLASTLLQTFGDRRWVVPARPHRALRLTTEGATALRDSFGIDPGPWL